VLIIVFLKQSLNALTTLQSLQDLVKESLNKIGEARNEMLNQITLVGPPDGA
jgi:hypothetical protein